MNSSRCRSRPGAICDEPLLDRCAPASPTCASSLGERRCASRANVCTARSSSRASRWAASSRARLTDASNCCAARLGEAARRALDDALELLDLAPLDVARSSPGSAAAPRPPRARSRSRQLALALLQPLGQLAQRAPPLGRVRLELADADAIASCGRLLELLAEPRERGALLLGSALEALDLRAHPRLDLRDRAARGAASAPASCACRATAARARGPRPSRRAAARRGAAPRPASSASCAVASRSRCAATAPPLLGEPPLVLGEQRDRLRAGAGERPLELGLALDEPSLDVRVEPALGLRDAVVDRPRGARARPRARQAPARRSCTRSGRPRRSRATLDGLERERDPGRGARPRRCGRDARRAACRPTSPRARRPRAPRPRRHARREHESRRRSSRVTRLIVGVRPDGARAEPPRARRARPRAAQRRLGRGGERRGGHRLARPVAQLDRPRHGATRRRTVRTWVESSRCAEARQRRERRRERAPRTRAARPGRRTRSAAGTRPRRARTRGRCGSGRRAARGCTRQTRKAPAATNGSSQSVHASAAQTPIAAAPRDRDDRERDEHARRDPRAERPPVQLVERVRADPEREEERERASARAGRCRRAARGTRRSRRSSGATRVYGRWRSVT